jgi:hypothetical protein
MSPVSRARLRRAAARFALALAWLLALAASAPARSETDRALEQRVKAAFLYRFTEFVNWPDTAYARADAQFVIVVAGPEAVAENLRAITSGRAVEGHAIDVRRIAAGEASPPAQLVYVASADLARMRETLRTVQRHALVVTEAENALDYGSVINFVIAGGRVRFDISLESAEKRGIRLSSRLLAVARSVRGNP